MTSSDIYIVGEDDVTREVIMRIIKEFAPSLNIIGALPARGSELKTKITNFNHLAQTIPIVLLSDLDTIDCAPLAKASLLKEIETQHPHFIINIAVDEAEAWLFADRKGFAHFLQVNEADMPMANEEKFGGLRKRKEISLPIKASYYLTHVLMKKSTNKERRKQLLARLGACKGPEYNSTMIPFIRQSWNIHEAMTHSYSLQGTVRRVQRLAEVLQTVGR